MNHYREFLECEFSQFEMRQFRINCKLFLDFEVFVTDFCLCVCVLNIFLILQQVLWEIFERMRYNLELLGVCVFKKKEKMVVVVVVGTGKGGEFEEMRLYEMNPSSYVKFFDFVRHAV